MINRFLQRFEDINHPVLGPTIWGLKYFGIRKSPEKSFLAKNWIHIIAFILLIALYIEVWRIKSDIISAFHGFSVTLQCTLGIMKVLSTFIRQKSWEKIINYVSPLELSQLSANDIETKIIINRYTKFSRRITCCYCIMVVMAVGSDIFLTLFSGLLERYNSGVTNATDFHTEILDFWTPFDKSQGFGSWLLFVVQAMFISYIGANAIFYDSNIAVLMAFFAGQMEILSHNCSQLFDNCSELTNADLLKRIKDCHEHHLSLITHAKILNSILSTIMFFYVALSSLMLCTTVLQFTSNTNTRTKNIGMMVFLMACVFQLFLYCWNCNEVLVMSEKVDEAVYSSKWWACDIAVRRCVLLLNGQVRQSVNFAAGPFVNLNLNTFIAIMKASYSYYTILSQIK